MDDAADMVIHERIEKIFTMVMKKLNVPIPEFRRNLRLKITKPKNSNKI